mgnify:CR=1 FL=1
MGDNTRAGNSGFANNVRNYIHYISTGEMDAKDYNPASDWQTEAMGLQYKKHAAGVREKYGIQGSRTVEVVDTAEAKKPGVLVRAGLFVHSIIQRLFSSEKHLNDHDVFKGIDLGKLNSTRRDICFRGGPFLLPLSEGEFKYLRAILVSRVKEGEAIDKEQITRDFRTLSKAALFAKYGGASRIINPVDRKLGLGAGKACKGMAEKFSSTMLGRPRSSEPSSWKQSLETVRERALQAARIVPEGEKVEAAKAVFDLHYKEEKRALRQNLSNAGSQFARQYGNKKDAFVEEYRSQLIGSEEGLSLLKDEKLKEQLLAMEVQGLEHGLSEALNSARSFYMEGVEGILIAYDQTWENNVPEMLNEVIAEAEQYHEEHNASDLSVEAKQAFEKHADPINERRVESMEAGGLKFDNIMMDSAEDRAEAYEAGKAVFAPLNPENYDELEGVSDFFEQMEAEALEAVQKAEREAEKATLQAEKKAVRANIKSKEDLLSVSMREDSDRPVKEHFIAQREVSAAKKEDKRLELEIVKIQAYDDEKQLLLDELEQKRQEPGFGNLSKWLDGFFNERISDVKAERGRLNEQIRAIKKNSLSDAEIAEEKALGKELAALMKVGDFSREQADRFNAIEDRHQFLSGLNNTYDQLTALRRAGDLTDDQGVRLDAMEAKIENLRQQQAVCEQTLKVIEQVREDYQKELQASRYSDPHAGEAKAGSTEWLKERKEAAVNKTRAALQVDLPELTDEDLVAMQSGLVSALGKSPLEAADVNEVLDLINRVPVEKAEAVLSALLADVEDKEILFATLLTNKAFVSLYQGVREEIRRASEISKDRSIELNNRRDAEQRLLYFTQISGKVEALCNVLSGQPGSVASSMASAVTNLSDREVRTKKGFFGGKETVTVFNPDVAVRGHLTGMAAKARA